MRRAANFNPEWGYLAPAPSFIRSARLVIVAAAIGATGGAAVVFSLADRPVVEQSVAARTLVQTPVESAPLNAAVVAQLPTESQHAQPQADAPAAALHRQSPMPAAPNTSAGLAAGEAAATATTQRPPGAVALAESPAVTDAPPPVQAVTEAVAAAPEAPAAQKPAPNKKPRVAWRAAPRYDAPRYYMYAPRYYGAQGFDQRYVQMGW
jgi:hypothetical protein